MPRAKRTEQEIAAMRERVLDAASDLLREEGTDGLSIRRIADRVGVSHMLLYSYFKDRAAIIQSLRERYLEKMTAFCAGSWRRAETGDALSEVRTSLEWFVRLSHERPMLYQLALRRSAHDAAMRIDSRNVQKLLNHLSRLIRLCIEREQCVDRDPSLAAVTAFSMVNGTLMLYHSQSAIAQTERTELEMEIIEAAMTYLTMRCHFRYTERGN